MHGVALCPTCMLTGSGLTSTASRADCLFVFQALSLGVAVRDPVSWSVCTADRPGVDPRIGALGSVALACSKILEESKGQVKPFGNVHKATCPAMCPAQVTRESDTSRRRVWDVDSAKLDICVGLSE